MGDFKESLRRIRETRFGAVPRAWPVGRTLLHTGAATCDLDPLRGLVLRWAAQKWPGLVPPRAYGGGDFEVVQAGLSITALSVPGDMWAFRSEHIDREAARTWVTEAMVACLDDFEVLGVRNICSSLGSQEPPASMPRFLRDAVRRMTFIDAGTPVSDKPIHARSAADGRTLANLILHRGRALPVNVVTVGRDGQPPVDCDYLAGQLSGIAHVVLASAEATFALRDEVGAEWAVYNGAIRTFYPGFDPYADEFHRHPLVLAPRIAAFEGGEVKGPAAFSAFVVKSQHDRSAAPTNGFTDFPDFFAFKSRALAARASSAGTSASDAERLALLTEQLDAAARERQSWQETAFEEAKKADAAQAQVDQLRAHIESLTAAIATLRERTPTVAEAVVPTRYEDIATWAQTNLSGRLVLHSRAVRSLKGAVYEDLPLVVDCLRLLAHEYRDMRMASGDDAGTARAAFDARMHALGVSTSGSITPGRAREYADEYFVDYVIGQRTRQMLEEHLTKGNGREERHCLRVYYFWDAEQQVTVVGSLPGHLRNRFT